MLRIIIDSMTKKSMILIYNIKSLNVKLDKIECHVVLLREYGTIFDIMNIILYIHIWIIPESVLIDIITYGAQQLTDRNSITFMYSPWL